MAGLPLLLLAFLSARIAAAQEADVARTTIDALRELPPGAGVAVDFEADVCYVDPIWNFVFLTDDGHGIFLGPNHFELGFGDRVRVRGQVGGGHDAPTIDGGNALRVDVLGKSVLPDPPLVDFGRWKGHTLSDPTSTNWVALHGRVEMVTLFPESARLWCRERGGRLVPVSLGEPMEPRRAWELVGSEVEVRGASGLLLGRKNEMLGPLLLSQGADLVRVLAEPSRVLPFPAKRRFLQADRSDTVAESLQIYGQATLVQPNAIYLEGVRVSLQVACAATSDVQLEQFVRVLGSRDSDGELRSRVLIPQAQGLLPFPMRISIRDLPGEHPGRRVAVQGDVVSYDTESHVLHLREDGSDLRVLLPDAIDSSSLDLRSASSAAIIGVYLPSGDAAPELIVAREDDLQILSRRFTLTARRLAVLLAAIVALVLAAVGFAFFMRVQVARRTSELTDATAQLRASYESIASGIVAIGSDGRVLAANRIARQKLGKELWPGDDGGLFLEAWDGIAKDTAPLQELVSAVRERDTEPASCQVQLRENEHAVLHVTLAPIHHDGKSVGHLWVLRDDSQLHLLQAELLQAQKMEAVGTLAGGLAHDFNNYLTVIIGSLELLSLSPDVRVGDKIRAIEAALAASRNAGELIKQLLTVSRKTSIEPRPCRPEDLIRDIQPLLRHGFDSATKLTFQVDLDLPAVNADPVCLQQALLNLCVNARDAMPEGGQITIGCTEDRLGSEPAVALFVRDAGPGIPDDVRERIFDPFFTTKKHGEGTGLGLSTSFGIAKQHGGDLRCISRDGEGAEFRMVLPRAAEQPAPESEEAVVHARGEQETILVVDDQWAVRSVGCLLLNGAGYRTIPAGGGLEALDIVRSGEHVDLILLDLSMPDLNGYEVLRILSEERPGLPVVLTSGYLPTSEAPSQASAFVSKPWRVNNVLPAIRNALDAETPEVREQVIPQKRQDKPKSRA
ncbi:MAG: ATP-binding protein [Planctomycetota bacterium]